MLPELLQLASLFRVLTCHAVAGASNSYRCAGMLDKDKSLGVNALRRMLQQQHGWTVSDNGIKKVR